MSKSEERRLKIQKSLSKRDEEERRIFEKYPKIFIQKDLPMSQTAMCWGLDIGEGWMWIIDLACLLIQAHIDWKERNKKPIKQLEATQVKEKFGGLRFYHTGGDDYTEAITEFAEALSYKVCENCGTTKNVTQNKGGWILTLCDECRKEHNPQRGI